MWFIVDVESRHGSICGSEERMYHRIWISDASSLYDAAARRGSQTRSFSSWYRPETIGMEAVVDFEVPENAEEGGMKIL